MPLHTHSDAELVEGAIRRAASGLYAIYHLEPLPHDAEPETVANYRADAIALLPQMPHLMSLDERNAWERTHGVVPQPSAEDRAALAELCNNASERIAFRHAESEAINDGRQHDYTPYDEALDDLGDQLVDALPLLQRLSNALA